MCCALQVHLACADTVWMQNGDRLTGEIRRIDAGKLILVTGYGGMISLDWSQVRMLESASLLLVRDEKMREEYLDRLRIPDGDATAIAAGQGQPSIELESSGKMTRQGTVLADAVWEGSLDLGLKHKTASTRTEDHTVRLAQELRYGNWRHHFNLDYTRRTDNSVTTSHNYGGRLSSDRFLSNQAFWQGRAYYKRDAIEEISRQATIGTGPGFQFWDNDLGAFSLAGLVGRVRYDYSDGTVEHFYGASLSWDYRRYLGGKRVELYTNGELTQPFGGAVDYSLEAIVGLRYRMTEWLSWFLSYSRNQISGGRQSLNERQISTGLGLTW